MEEELWNIWNNEKNNHNDRHMATMLFAALNQTIVGTALPRIIAELGGMEYFSWVFTIYMLASSITAHISR